VKLVQNWECYSHASGVKTICSMGLCGRVGGVNVETSLCEGVCDVILLRFLIFFLVVAHFVASFTGRKCACSLSLPLMPERESFP